jgi:hypothetical protein
MTAMKHRLAKLEQAAAPGATLHVWVEDGETKEQAIARQFPEGEPDDATVVVYRWAGAEPHDLLRKLRDRSATGLGLVADFDRWSSPTPTRHPGTPRR